MRPPAFRLARHAALAFAAWGLVAPASAATALSHDHPLLGSWKVTLPDGSCSETYFFRSDGTSLVTSADEVAESDFEVSLEPTDKGFYKLVDKIVRDNGKQDCQGNVTTVGQQATNFITFHPSGQMFLMCREESLEACIGPFRREEGLDT